MSRRGSRRKFQLSLRFLFVLTAVFALMLAPPIQRSLLQKRGRAWVESQNGHVTFAHKYDAASGVYKHDSQFPAPSWLVGIFGVDFFDSVDAVVLDNMEVVDLSPLTNFRELRSLGIMIEIDDKLDFRPLAELKKLENLHLAYTDISAERLGEIRELLDWVTVTAANHPEK
ncbi:MAG: hypothetical protein P8R31_11900 [Mariniblastus sp.]|nr:hypothetical protein [Mariniblastus sp.]